jgi:hypothetical protein
MSRYRYTEEQLRKAHAVIDEDSQIATDEPVIIVRSPAIDALNWAFENYHKIARAAMGTFRKFNIGRSWSKMDIALLNKGQIEQLRVMAFTHRLGGVIKMAICLDTDSDIQWALNTTQYPNPDSWRCHHNH